MKKKYIVLIVILILIIVIAGIFIYERLHASLYVNEEGTSFSVIGGADGPTDIFVAGKIPDEDKNEAESNEEDEMKLIIGDTEVSVSWEQNAAVTDLEEAVGGEPIVIEMSMYGGFEQVGSIGRNLTRNRIRRTSFKWRCYNNNHQVDIIFVI